MNSSPYLVPAMLALVGGGALLYFALRRDQGARKDISEMDPATTASGGPVYCDIRAANPCGARSECVPLYYEGEAPRGYENAGMCFR